MRLHHQNIQVLYQFYTFKFRIVSNHAVKLGYSNKNEIFVIWFSI